MSFQEQAQAGASQSYAAYTGRRHSLIEPELEVDQQYVDHDPSRETDELMSLSSSIAAYERENGRRENSNHGAKTYTPNDRPDMDRDDMKHHWFKIILEDNLHLATFDYPKHILDLGAGTGIWCVEMGDKYPEANITGTDLSKIHTGMVLPNVHFETADWDNTWAYSHHFDFIYNRFNSTAVSNWPELIRKSFAALKPGGWIELADLTNPAHSDDGSIPLDSRVCELFGHLTSGCSKIDRDLHAPKKWSRYLKDAGFVNIQSKQFKVPVGGWPKDPRMKEAGVFEKEALLKALPAIGKDFFMRVLQWTPAEVEELFVGVRKELDNRKIHFWLPMCVTWAQKPQA